MSRQQDNKLMKVAVTMDKQPNLFLELNQKKPLVAFIDEVCKQWKLPNPENYSLRFDEKEKKGYITERNRVEIQKGFILKLSLSASKTASNLLQSIEVKNNEEVRLEAMKETCEISQDIIFAHDFISKNGLIVLIQLIQTSNLTEDLFILVLKTCLNLMSSTSITWDVFDEKFIKNVAFVVNKSAVPNLDLLKCSLEILKSIVLHSPEKYETVEKVLKINYVIQHIQVANLKIQINVIALVNALFLRGNETQITKLFHEIQSNSIRNLILNNIIRVKPVLSDDMQHELYVLQSLIFSQLNIRKRTPVELTDQNASKEISNLRRLAFDSEVDNAGNNAKKQSHSKDYQRLGFSHPVNPLLDFLTLPPGILALDCMAYFSKMHGEDYARVVLENSCKGDEHDCPFAKASIELTINLLEILKIGEQPSNNGLDYYPMFFTHDRPFEEFYCISVDLLNRTWKEMKATLHDFNKVLNVVREQLTRALATRPKSYEDLRLKLQTLTYAQITSLWNQERKTQEESDSQVKPIRELRELLRPEMMSLIKKQRLHHLVLGTIFRKYTKGAIVKGKFWFCCLSANHKCFHYGDCDEDRKPPLDQLPHKLPVSNIHQLLTGRDCPHIREVRGEKEKIKRVQFAFSIVPDTESTTSECLNFLAPTTTDFHLWQDGINALIGRPMESLQTREDLEMLLKMELKIHLLDIEGIALSDSTPPIPKDPPNYDYYCRR